jgi:hypothetical protein
MTTPYGLESGQMQTIINATQSAIDQMLSLNTNVQSVSGDICAHNQSDAGRIVQGRLETWNSDFYPIINAISELNGKVAAWMNTSIQAGDQARTAAQAGFTNRLA